MGYKFCFVFRSVFLSSLYILDANPLSDVQLSMLLSHFVGFIFALLVVILAVQKSFTFMSFHLSIVDFNSWANGVPFGKDFTTLI